MAKKFTFQITSKRSKERKFKRVSEDPQPKKQEPLPKKKAVPSLIDRVVYFRDDEHTTMAGKVCGVSGGTAEVKLALPNRDGLLVVGDSSAFVDVDNVCPFDGITRKGTVKQWESNTQIKQEKTAATKITDENDVVRDYQNVFIEGLGSTFANASTLDRDGEYIVEGAFNDSLAQFKRNPVMLIDHERSVYRLAGRWEKVGTTASGLSLRGKVSNGPDLAQVRFHIVEKSLSTLSIGGIWFYLEDFRGIDEVDLYEVSLVVVPANPGAEFQVRGLELDLAAKMFERHSKQFGGEIRVKAGALRAS